MHTKFHITISMSRLVTTALAENLKIKNVASIKIFFILMQFLVRTSLAYQ